MSELWLTSDLHIGHVNIIAYTGRPFAGVDEMDEWLVTAWNEVVGVDDTVWVIGDVCMGQIDRSLARVSQLHGTRRLVSGNHDRTFRKSGIPQPTWEAAYRAAGFASIHHGTIEIDLGLTAPTLACHFPYSGDSHAGDRYPEHRPIDNGAPLLHGHTHGAWMQHRSMIDVGVDTWAGRPVSADHVATLLANGPAELQRLPWTAADGS